MKTSHNIKYEGLELEVFGDWEEPEEETGNKGGWSTTLIKINGVDIYWMLTPYAIEQISSIVIEENY